MFIDSLERIAHSVMIKQGLDLSIDREIENIVYQNAGVNVIFYPQLITDKERKTAQWLTMRRFKNKNASMAELVKRWSTGDNRPDNGAFMGFTLNRSGKVCLPLFI